MKILQVITSLHIGGAEKLIVDMVPKYQERGYEVDVLLFDGTETPFTKQLMNKGIKIYDFGIGNHVYNPLNIFRLIPFLKKYDIVHTHNTAPQFFAAFGSLFCKVKLVTTEHSTSNRRRNLKWFRYIDKWMYNRYRSIICISDAAEKNLKEYLQEYKALICTIYNGVDVQHFVNAQPLLDLRTQAGNKCVVVMVAGFRYQKDQDTLIKAFNFLSKDKFELWLVGDGVRRKLLEELVRENGLQDSVHFLGIRSDVPSILKTADIVVMSSHFEGLSLSNIEGMSVGKPFIASDVDGLHEMTKGVGVLFPHEDAVKLAKAIEYLSENRGAYITIANQCLKKAEEFDISKTIIGYERVYNSIK